MQFNISEKVKIKNSTIIGKIIKIEKNKVMLEANKRKISTTINMLEHLSDDEINNLNKPNVTYKYKENKPYTVSLSSKPERELMIRHQDSITAMQNVEKFLDTAYVNRYTEVRIIHGKRGGILRNALHELLNSHPYVESYELGDYYTGQYGVTIVKLKILN